MRALVLVGLALLVASCGRSDDSNTAPAAPADAPAGPPPPTATTDFARPINALGNEPFWSLRIRPDGLTFSAPDQEDLKASNPGPQVEGAQATWTGDAAGQPLRAVLRAQVCQDGMSGFSYPFTATVEVQGRTLMGCAAYADAMPRE